MKVPKRGKIKKEGGRRKEEGDQFDGCRGAIDHSHIRSLTHSLHCEFLSLNIPQHLL